MPEELFQLAFQCIPSNPYKTYARILKACIEFDCSNKTTSGNSTILSNGSYNLLETLVEFWIIDYCARALILFNISDLEVFKNFYEARMVTSHKFLEILEAIMKKIEEAVQANVISKPEQIDDFTVSSPKEFVSLVSILEFLERQNSTVLFLDELSSEENIMQLVGSLIKESIAIRFNKFVPLKTDSGVRIIDGNTLKIAAHSVSYELAIFKKKFDSLILERFHIPSIAGKLYIDGLIMQIEFFFNQLVEFGSVANSLDVGFSVYSSVREIIKICESIDFRLLDNGRKFKVVQWFSVFVEEFVGLSEKKINEWIQNAIAVDDFNLQSSGHSSSVFDIFISFQQQIEFILRLNWPSDYDTQRYIWKIVENIGEGLEKYAHLMKQSIISDLKPSNLLSAPLFSTKILTSSSSTSSTPGEPSTKGKFFIQIRKQGPPVDPSEIRISAKSCVKLCNVESLLRRFDDLVETIPEKFKVHQQEKLPVQRISLDGEEKIKPRISGTLSVVHVSDLQVVQPFSTKVSIRICTMPPVYSHPSLLQNNEKLFEQESTPAFGREIGRTGEYYQSRTILFSGVKNSDSVDIPFLLTNAEILNGLQIMVVHHTPPVYSKKNSTSTATTSSSEYLVAVERFSVLKVIENAAKSEITFTVNIAGGKVTLKIALEDRFVSGIVRDRLKYVVNRTIDESRGVVVDKRNLMAPLSSSELPTEIAVDIKLTPFLNFVNVNLGIIAETISSVSLANRVVLGIWKRFVEISESLVVPSLNDDIGLLDRKKIWENSRVAFLGYAVMIVKDFLYADGNGLPKEELENQSLGQLEMILRFYSWQKRDLLQKHMNEMGNVANWSDAWLLKLLKLKGGNTDYIVEVMRRKVE
ncbi:hypothetical protein HK100_005936, partial [Physocladia obscura]